jgi:hypothetical protein
VIVVAVETTPEVFVITNTREEERRLALDLVGRDVVWELVEAVDGILELLAGREDEAA